MDGKETKERRTTREVRYVPTKKFLKRYFPVTNKCSFVICALNSVSLFLYFFLSFERSTAIGEGDGCWNFSSSVENTRVTDLHLGEWN